MKRKRRRRRRSGVLPRLLLLLLFVCAGVMAVYCSVVRPPEMENETSAAPAAAMQENPGTPDSREDRRPDCYIILVSGVDDGNGGSDTNILVSFDAAENQVHCVSVPRDTLVDVSRNVKKINAAYNIGGTRQLAEEVSSLLGIPVDFTIQVDLQGFVELIDAIGGVDFEIPLDMDYDDPVQGLSIHFRQGLQHLDGEDALKVVRFRHNNDGSGYGTEDVGRIGTQQAFLKAVAGKLLTTLDISVVSQLSSIFKESVETELSVGNLIWLGQEAFAAGLDNITFETLPGNGAGYYQGVSYYTLYPEETLAMVNTSLNPYTTDRDLSDLDILVP